MRKLTLRERILLLILAIVAVISGYILLFYMPTAQRIESLNAQIAQSEELVAQLEVKLEDQRRMEQELKQISTQEDASPSMPEYDNLQAVMVELNRILVGCQNYSLSFQEDQTQDHIFGRQVTIPFTCANYDQAKDVLQKLHDSSLRGLLGNVQLSQQQNGTVRATATITFYEYQPETPES